MHTRMILLGAIAAAVAQAQRTQEAPLPDEEVTTIATLSPGGEATTTVDFTAGEYTIFCVPQAKHGMRHALRVAAAPRAGGP